MLEVRRQVLVEQRLMINVLADLCLEMEAAWLMIQRLCRAYGQSNADPQERAFARLATAVAKFWVCKRCPQMVVECLECLGGNGYTEDFPLARIFRESPLLSVWEGSGNVISLDILRSFQKEPESLQAFLAEVSQSEHVTKQSLQAKVVELAQPFSARRLAQTLAIHWQMQLMEQSTTTGAAEAFSRSRLEEPGGVFGLQAKLEDCRAIVNTFMSSFS